jgi:hypothetical protein
LGVVEYSNSGLKIGMRLFKIISQFLEKKIRNFSISVLLQEAKTVGLDNNCLISY